MMDRRHILPLLGATALSARIPVALAQASSRPPVIGFLNSGSPETFGHLAAGFQKGLAESGLADGRNCRIEYRWAQGDYARLPELAAELAKLPADVLVSSGGAPAVIAARQATTTIPIVFSVSDPVRLGLVQSLARPGGNATDISLINHDLTPKRVQLLAELVPAAATLGVLTNQSNPAAKLTMPAIVASVEKLGRTVVAAAAGTSADIDAAFRDLARQNVQALYVNNDPLFFIERQRIVARAAEARLPAIYDLREFPAAGGLASYGSNLVDGYRRLGLYAAQIVAGARPADLPVWQPTHFELVVNARAAKALGLTIPPAIFIQADEVIE